MITDDHNRFTISVDGEPAGFTAYLDRDGERYFHHTEIGPEFGGRGLAGQLVAGALAETTVPIVSVCPFVRGWLEKNEHDHTWRLPTPADITWLKENLR